MLDFYENNKACIKAAQIVKSHHLNSNVRAVELCLFLLIAGKCYVQLNSQFCAYICFKTEHMFSLLQINVE